MKSFPTSWNRIPRVAPSVVYSCRQPQLPDGDLFPKPFAIYGNGRSYSDVCLTDGGTLIKTRGLDRFIEFDPAKGLLACQSGVTLEEILAITVPQGWFLPVTPGTRYATVGGAIANDVHGKNHHVAGSFGHYVRKLELIRSNGERILCSANENSAWFSATVGGLGLTGLIVTAEIQLVRIQSPWMWVESHRFSNLDEFWALNRSVEDDWPYTVSWIDCLAKGDNIGRGIMYAGRHAPAQCTKKVYREVSRRIPIDSPISLVNSLSLRAFNELYFRKPVYPAGGPCHYVPYFYPLDAIKNWNRMYGRSGFYQYQCVIPPSVSPQAIRELLESIARSRQGSFLAVLKTFGPVESVGMLSFPRPGATLALDFPNLGDKTLKLLSALDDIVGAAGGALYPAKDARMPASMFRQSFPKWESFAHYVDPGFSSHFWERVTHELS